MSGNPKVIVLTGHGAWQTKAADRHAFAMVPGKCSIHFYTTNFTLMYTSFGDELDKGKFGQYTPSQTAGPYKSAPNMVLTWPRGLTVPPPPKGWASIVYEKGVSIPADDRNIQFQLKRPEHPLRNMLNDPLGHMYLEDIFDVLTPAISQAKSVLFVWSACREVLLTETKDLSKKKVTSSNEDINSFIEDLAELVQNSKVVSPKFNDLKWRIRTWRNRVMSMEQVMEELEKYIDLQKIIQAQDDPEDALEELEDDIKLWLLEWDRTWKYEKQASRLNKGKTRSRTGKENVFF